MSRTSTFPLLATAALAAFGPGCGGSTLAELDGTGDEQSCDGGVCDPDDPAPQGHRLEVDCCEPADDDEEAACDTLYSGEVPEGWEIIDTCDDNEPADCEGLEGLELFGCQFGEPPGNGGDEDPCEGLEGLELLACQFGEPPGSGGEEDPCEGLEGLELLTCQLGEAGSGSDCEGLEGAELLTCQLGEVVNGGGGMTDVGDLGALLDLLGLFSGSGGTSDNPLAGLAEAFGVDCEDPSPEDIFAQLLCGGGSFGGGGNGGFGGGGNGGFPNGG